MTTTTYLEIEDQATGANNNTWGDVADANFEILEWAIARVVTVNTTGGSTTLTSAQNRRPTIIITGTLASNATIVVRTAEKNWRFLNLTTGAFNVTVKTLAGSGVRIPRGAAVKLYCDGTDVKYLRGQTIPQVAAGGTVDAITATFEPALTSNDLQDDLTIMVTASGANTSTTPTLNANGLGAVTITRDGGQALQAGDIPRAGFKTLLSYRSAGPSWELLNPSADATNAVKGLTRLSTLAETLLGVSSTTAVPPNRLAALWGKGANVASAATTTIPAGGFFLLTGNTQIDAFTVSNEADGREFELLINAATGPVISNNAAIVTGTGSALRTRANMKIRFRCNGAGVVYVTNIDHGQFFTGPPDVVVEDQKASGTDGGDFKNLADDAAQSGNRTRTLNTLVRNVDTLVSLASNKVTFPAGNYWIEFEAPAGVVNAHQVLLYDVTNAAVLARGTSETATNSVSAYTRSTGGVAVAFTAATEVEIRHRCQTTRNTDGMGRAGGFGTEVYARLKAWRLP